MTIEFIEPTRLGKTIRFATAALGIAALALLEFWLRPVIAQAKPCEQLFYGKVLVLVTSFTLVGISMSFAYYAYKILRAKQFPLPGAWVIHRTPVKRDKTVQVRAIIFLLGSAIVIMCTAIAFKSFNAITVDLNSRFKCSHNIALDTDASRRST